MGGVAKAIVPIAAATVGGIGAGPFGAAAGYELGSRASGGSGFKGVVDTLTPPKIPEPAPPPPVVTPTEEPVKQLQAEEEKRRRIVGGRASTILTSPLGVSGDPTVSRKTLLGQ